MQVRIQCPHCNKVIAIPTTLAGKKGRCPGCKFVIQIPATLTPEEPANDVYDAEDASTAPPSTPEPNDVNDPSPFDNAGMNDTSGEELGYGLSSELLNELDKQPAIPSHHQEEIVERFPCPVCKEMIVRGAAKCHHCGEIFDLVLKEHEKHRQKKLEKRGGGDDDDLNAGEIAVGLLCGGIACIVSIVWMIQGKKKGIKMFGLAMLSVFFWNIVSFILQNAGNHP